jgi:hypothetical protein
VQSGFLLSALTDYPGGIRAYVNPSTGASYAAWLYPNEGVIKLWRTTTWNINTSPVLLATSGKITFDAVNWHTLALSLTSGQLVVSLDGATVASATDTTLSGGLIALDVSSKPIQFTNILVTGPQTEASQLTSPQSGYTFNVAAGSGASATQPLQIATNDSSVTAWSALSTSPWLTVAATTGSTPGSATVQVNASTLTAGTYNGQINLTSFGTANSIIGIPVTVNVTQPSTNQLSVSPASLQFTAPTGGTAPPAQSLSLSSTTSGLAFSLSSDSTWLSASPLSGATPATLQVTANQNGLATGTYTGHLTISSPAAQNPTTTVTVTLTVSSVTLTAAPVALNFVGSTTTNSPIQGLTITSSGVPTGWTASYGSGWLSLSATSGTTPSTLQAQAITSALSSGTYTDRLTVSPTGGGGINPLAIPVSLRVGPLLFSDNFTSNSNWTASPVQGLGTNWKIVNNTYTYSGGGGTLQYAGSSSWTNYTFQADMTLTTANNYPGGVRFRLNTATGSGYAIWLYPVTGQVKLIKAPNWNIDSGDSTLTTVSKVSLPVGTHHLRIDAQGSTITVFVDYVQILSFTDTSYSAGAIALDVSSQPVAFANVSVISY